MILVHSRKHIPDLIARLQARGLPVMADKQGELLKQPVVQPLMAMLELLARPGSDMPHIPSFAPQLLGRHRYRLRRSSKRKLWTIIGTSFPTISMASLKGHSWKHVLVWYNLAPCTKSLMQSWITAIFSSHSQMNLNDKLLKPGAQCCKN